MHALHPVLRRTLLTLTAVTLSGTAAAASLTSVATANPKTPGVAAPNVLSPELELRLVATGSTPLDGATDKTRYYGYIDNGLPQSVRWITP